MILHRTRIAALSPALHRSQSELTQIDTKLQTATGLQGNRTAYQTAAPRSIDRVARIEPLSGRRLEPD